MVNKNINYEVDWDSELEISESQSQNRGDKNDEILILALLFMGVYGGINSLDEKDLTTIGGEPKKRYLESSQITTNPGPWNYSPSGFLDASVTTAIMSEIGVLGVTGGDMKMLSGAVDTKNMNIWQKTGNDSELIGYRADHETKIQAAMEGYYGYNLKIPFTTCEDNDNCSSSSPVCDDCESYRGELFAPEDFPDTHDWCRCNDPMAEPEVVSQNIGGEVFF